MASIGPVSAEFNQAGFFPGAAVADYSGVTDGTLWRYIKARSVHAGFSAASDTAAVVVLTAKPAQFWTA